MASNYPCADCSLRKKYEKKPKSLAGRFWRWHINFCPGFKKFFNSLEESEKQAFRKKYDFTKY